MHNPIPIKVEMAKRGFTAERLAELSGVSRPTVSKIVHGQTVRPSKLKIVADLLGVSMQELFTPKQEVEETELATV